jgi:hypothetical protein
MLDVPLPKITKVPVAIKLIGSQVQQHQDPAARPRRKTSFPASQ